MQRYFIDAKAFQGDQVIFTGDEHHHITRVMRSNIGDRVIASDGSGRDVIVELENVEKDRVVACIVERLEENRELPIQVTLAQGLAKGEKMDFIVQKTTEMGVHRIVPFTSSRTIVKLNDKKENNRLQRWQKIAKEAAEQAHRSRIPEIGEVVPLKEIIKDGKEYDLALIAYELEHQQKLAQLLGKLSNGSQILVVIGPEGGFSEEEVALAEDNGFHSVTLGRRILRTETAGIAALAMLSYHFE